jgi:hypothetical protein
MTTRMLILLAALIGTPGLAFGGPAAAGEVNLGAN